jgi:hypothetical protein
MAKVVFGGGVVSMSGKIAGSVFSRNKGGAYVRAKVKPSNPKSSSQTLVRGWMSMISQLWRTLGDAAIQQWNAAAKSDASVHKNGHTSQLSGHQYHQQLNRNLLQVGSSVITSPPLRVEAAQMSSVVVSAAKAVPTFTITFAPAIPSGTKVIVSATAPCSPGKSNLNGKYRVINILDHSVSSPYSGITDYVAKFGSMGAAGLRIGVKVRPVDSVTGIAGIGVTAECIIAT